MSLGIAPMVFRTPISFSLSTTDMRTVFATPNIAMRSAIAAIEKTNTRVVETSVMMVCLTWLKLTTCTFGS